MPTHLWVASNNLFASIRPYQPPLEAASSTGLRPLKKYPQLGWGMLIFKNKFLYISIEYLDIFMIICIICIQ